MQITRQSEYAIRILIELAKYPLGELVPSKIIAEKQDIPGMFLQKTVQLLSRAGIVSTQRGVQGGVRLTLPADMITVADVIIAIEGPMALNPCLSPGYSCPNMASCPVRKILGRAQSALLHELRRESIADLAMAGEHTKGDKARLPGGGV